MKKEKMVTLIVKNGTEFTVELPESKIAELLGGKCCNKVQLSSIKAGETFSIGKHEWVVLEQSGDTTAVLLKDCLDDLSKFDDNSNNWISSYIREWLNDIFAKEIVAEIGDKNLVAHTSDISTDDGSDSYQDDGKKDKVSLLSCSKYRKYYKVIPKTDKWYWTLTPISSRVDKGYVRCVCYDGTLNCNYCYFSGGGVRPFCIFKSNIFVSRGEQL